MPVTINGITCQELVDGYTESYDITGGPSARKGYLCDWTDRFTVIHGILGLSSTTRTGGVITLKTPLAYPELASESTNALASMYARSVEVYGVGSPAQGTNNIIFTKAKVYVTFGSFPWTFTGIDFFQLDPLRPYIWADQTMDFGSENIGLAPSSVKFATSGKSPDEGFVFPYPLVDMSIRLINVPYLPIAAALTAAAAPLNNATFLGCAPRTVMFKGMQTHRTQATDGTQTAEITVGFTFRSVAQWDYKLDQTTGLFDQIVTKVGGNAILQASDLSQIIPSFYG